MQIQNTTPTPAGVLAFLQGKKTYFVAAGAALTAVGAYLNKSITLTELVSALYGAVATTTLRAGITKSGPQ